jgi:hypothetical protein
VSLCFLSISVVLDCPRGLAASIVIHRGLLLEYIAEFFSQIG